MKIAIIGGSGFIGTRLCDRLSKSNDIHFNILDKKISSKYPQQTIKCDITNIQEIESSLDMSFDAVIQLAAEHKDNVSPVSLYYDVNVEGQKNILKVMDQVGINKLIFTSSVAVYGFVEKDTGEEGSINPFNDYGKSKY